MPPLSTLLLLAGVLGSEPRSDDPIRIRRDAFVMGTKLVVLVEAESRLEGLRAGEDVVRAIERIDGLLSNWDPESVLSSGNTAPVGESWIPPADVARLLAQAERWARRTERAFEPVLGALIDAWDLRGEGRRPDAETLSAARAVTGPRGARVDPWTGVVERFDPAAWIDSGAFGKGAALAAAGEALRRAGVRSATVDLGGQVLAVGSPAADPAGWIVPVAHPLHRERPVVELRLRSASAATSGASERGVVIGNERVGHILDPGTGRPVPAWGSVTVVAADPTEADILATALFAMGPERALAWARLRPAVAALVLEPAADGDVRARWTPAMESWLVREPHEPVGTSSPSVAAHQLSGSPS